MQKVLDATKYSGISEKNVKAISASQIGSDPQEVLMKYKYGVIEDIEVGQNTIGSLVHMALEHIYKDEANTLCEYKPKPIEIDGWFLTGSIDRVDVSKRELTDIKVTKTYAIEKMKKDDSEAYKWQLSAYRYLMKKNTGDDYKCFIEAWNKQGGFDVRKGVDIPSVERVKIEPYSYEEVETKFKELKQFVELGSEKQCDDVFLRKVKGNTVPLRCLKYCSYNKVCKYYNPKPDTVMTGWDV